MVSSDSIKSVQDVTERGAGELVAGRYRLARKIGSGGMGSVWLAHDQSLDANCAIKLIDDDKAADEEIRTRFAREAKASARLRSAHVVDVFDYGEWNGKYYIAMEYLEGEDLSTRLERAGRLDAETTYRIVAHVARALMSAHSQGIVHRDLKPENIFLVQSYDEEIAKVLDFGIAQNSAYSLDNRATREGSFLGTPCYMSPEQARGKSVDHRSDLWSLGVIAFQCLTGKLPFESAALGELMGLILYEPLPKATTFNENLPAGFDGWWEHAAARDREDRFQSAKAMADELSVLLGVHAVVSVPTVPPKYRSSFPPSNEKSGVITAPKAAKLPSGNPTPEPRIAQTSMVQVVASAERTLEAETAPLTPRDSVTQLKPGLIEKLSKYPAADRYLKRWSALDNNAKRLLLAIPFVSALVVLGVILGFVIWGRSAHVVVVPANREPSSMRAEPRNESRSASPAQPAADTLTVDMLPLLAPSGQRGASEPNKSNSELSPRKSDPGSNRVSPRATKPARDYGI